MANNAELKVCSHQCNECLFTNNRIVRPERADELVEDCLKSDRFFECHKGTLAGLTVVCRGFWNRYKSDVWPLRIAQMYPDNVKFVDPEGLNNGRDNL